ncbi:HAMP domain-containing protein, partial [Natrarchaeobius sp. A-rgal3]|uniref:HAMP domain-containing protein n=1 Tax=Natrarchaeobius versutus TaxID=1679078 RepID=UPI00350ED5DA
MDRSDSGGDRGGPDAERNDEPISARLVPDRLRRSYVAKFGLVILAVLVLTAGVAGFFYLDISSQITETSQGEVEMSAEFQAEKLSNEVNRYEQIAASLATHDRIVDREGVQIEARLNNEHFRGPEEIQAMHYVDLETDTVTQSTDRTAVGTDLSELDLDVHVRSRSGVSEYSYEDVDLTGLDSTFTDTFEHDGENVVAFISPVENTDSDGAIVVVVPVAELATDVDSTIDGDYTEVVDIGDGDVMVGSDEDAVLSTYRDGEATEIVEEARFESGTAEFDDAGEIVGYAHVSDTDWVLLFHAPQSNAYALVDNVANSLIALIAVALAGFLFIGATIGRSTAKALDDIAEDATALSNGDTDVEITTDGRIDEIGQVRNSFRDISQYVETATHQSNAIAQQEFDDPALEQAVPGTLGESLATMHTDLESYIEDVEASKAEAEASREEAAEARQEAEALAQRLERKATEFGDVMGVAADGDLTQRLDDDVDNE